MINSFNEILDVVDKQDNIVGHAPRHEVHKKKLMHRSIHVLVFNLSGNLFLQKRSLIKDENPGLWDTSVSGHVDSGENYFDCANREINEELGINVLIDELVQITPQVNTNWEHVRVYTAITNSVIQINRHEILEGKYFPIEEVSYVIKESPENFTPTFLLIFNTYIKEY